MRMTSITPITNILKKSHHVGATTARNLWSSRVSVSVIPRPFQVSWRHEAAAGHTHIATDAARQGSNEAIKASQDTKDATGKVIDTVGDLAEKATQTAEEGWGSVKHATQKIKDTMVDMAEESKESVEQNAEAVRRSMNVKNYN